MALAKAKRMRVVTTAKLDSMQFKLTTATLTLGEKQVELTNRIAKQLPFISVDRMNMEWQPLAFVRVSVNAYESSPERVLVASPDGTLHWMTRSSFYGTKWERTLKLPTVILVK